MSIQTFITNNIENGSAYELSSEDQKTIQYEGLNKFIFNKLNSSKYRATSIDEGYRQKVIDKITLCLNQEIPIHITLPFGATKNPYLPTAPNIDWAEVFNIAFIRDYLKPIAKAYKHGVILEYISVAVFEEKVNRIPIKDTDLYDSQFTKLIEFYRRYMPENLQLNFSRVSDLIPRDKIERQIAIKKEELRKKWENLPKDVRDYKLFRARRNVLFDINEKNSESLILDAVLGHDAFCSECWSTDPAPWDKKHMITLGHTYTSGWAIHVRSVPGSTINFWSGTGVVVEKGNKFTPTVLSPSQYNNLRSNIKYEEYENDQLTGINNNFNKIPVITQN